jgi:two-component system CheB/CheR fusion protein
VTNAGAANADFEALLDYVKEHRGFDFTGYKRPSLERRVAKRMQEVRIDDVDAYRRYLEKHPDEFGMLFDTILINVTTFFRDPAAWDFLASEVIPTLLQDRLDDGPVRVWSAACSTGEEAYTAAMILCEAMGEEAYRSRVKIYATDVDESALNASRSGVFSAKSVSGTVPPDLAAKYFDHLDGAYTFRPDLRRTIIFGRHDLVQDAPISRVDLLICRNTLMYFTAETQLKILGNFHFALNERGVLFLGKSEVLVARTNLFTPIDLRRRVFAKVPRDGPPVRVRPPRATDAKPADGGPLRDAAFELAPVAQLVIDESGELMQANQRARRLFAVRTSDVGRPFQDLDLSYRPVELRSWIDEATESRRAVVVRDARWETASGETHWLDVEVVPLTASDGRPGGVAITFTDTTRYKWLEDDLQRSQREIETAYEELQSTVEELETTNEELQSTNEELETTNEELHSTNEELETMNEELQSTNEELETMNDEFRQRSDELNLSNAFLSAILGSLSTAVVVVDHDLTVHIWNAKAEDLWGIRADEAVGTHLVNLDAGLAFDELRKPVRACLAGEGPVTLELPAVTRKGRAITARISIRDLTTDDDPFSGVIILMEEAVAES